LRFLPPHLNPLIPVRKVTRTIDISSVGEWDTELSVVFPSGSGIKAWLGDGGNDRVSELEVEIIDGYPTLIISLAEGSGDHITLEMTVGSYFAFNNVTGCFFSATGAVLLIMLFIFLFIIKGIVRRKKEKAEDAELEKMTEEGDGGAKEVGSTEPPKTTAVNEKGEEVLNW
jgi:hypothetical protein